MKAEEIRKMVREEFQDVAFASRHPQLTHLACKELRERLLSTEPMDFPYFIGHFLLDALLTRQGEPLAEDDVIAMIRFLDGYWPIPVESDCAEDKLDLGIARHKREAFSALSSGQQNVILNWLLYAKTWPELWIAEAHLKSAITYWTARVRRKS